MDIPAFTHALERLWQQIEALHRQAREAAAGQDTPFIHAVTQLGTALQMLRTTQEARHHAHEAAEAQGEAQRRDLTDANTQLQAELTTRKQALVSAGRTLIAAWAAHQRAEGIHASLTQQLQVHADQLAIVREQLATRTEELLAAPHEIKALHAELLATNAELLAFNTALLAQVSGEAGTDTASGQLPSPPVERMS
jgi:chromosome segregation ATPase